MKYESSIQQMAADTQHAQVEYITAAYRIIYMKINLLIYLFMTKSYTKYKYKR